MNSSAHNAIDASLGFRYQGLYALLALWRETDDDASVLIETLDDVVFHANGETLLEQLKHSLSENTQSLTTKSVSLWSTLKVWIDVLPEINISQTQFNLVSVAEVSAGSVLEVLLTKKNDRTVLFESLNDEARRVLRERQEAKAAGQKSLPHSARVAGCEAYLALNEDIRIKLVERISLKPGQENIANIEEALANSLKDIIPDKRARVAQGLVEWWDRQVLFSMCGKRNKVITRFELVQRHMEIVSDIELDQLTSPFATLKPPSTYQPDSMIEQQISLVGGSANDLSRSIREEWRARETRSVWSTENPSRHDLICRYDDRLTEEWSDRHSEFRKSSESSREDELREKGYELFKWSHFSAPQDLEPIAPTIVAPYYVRGSYQVLSIVGRVGWHPHYLSLLGFEE